MAVSGSGHPRSRGTEQQQDFSGIGAEQVMNELLNIVEDCPTFLDGVDNRREIIVDKHHVGSVFRDVRSRDAHRDADVGHLDRCRVVNTVAGHGDNVAVRAQGRNNSQLVLGGDACVDTDLFDALAQLRRPKDYPGRFH